MKTLFLIIAISAFNLSVYAQVGGAVVTDPGAYAHLVENVKASLESVNALKKQTEILNETREALSKVSQTIRDFQIIDNIINNQTYIFSQTKTSINKFQKSNLFSPDELSTVVVNFTSIINQSGENLKLANQLLKDNGLKMSDAERLKLLMEMNANSNSSKNKFVYLDQKYDRLMQKKVFVQTFGR